jgi:hypothetical protein
MTEGSISRDVYDLFVGQLLRWGAPALDHQVTAGTGLPTKLLSNVNVILPKITIHNSGGFVVLVGYNANPTFPLNPNDRLSLWWKNPVKNGLCFNDLGNPAIIDVIG